MKLKFSVGAFAKALIALSLVLSSAAGCGGSDSTPAVTVLSIAVSPATGLMTFTRMLSFANSAAIERLVTIAAPLLPLYQVSPGRGLTPAVDAMVMNTPFLCARKCGTTCRAVRKRLFTLTW